MLLPILHNRAFLLSSGGLLLVLVLVLLLINVLAAAGHRPLVFTASDSLQPGVYLRKFFGPVAYQDNLLINLGPAKTQHLAQFYPRPVKFLMKQVIGRAGDHVCWTPWSVQVRHAQTGKQFYFPVLNQALFLPDVNNQCQTIGPGAFFVAGTHPESFDSRYFGLILPAEAGGIYYARPIFS